MGLGARYIREESSPHTPLRLVVFHHRRRFPVAGYQPLAARAASWISDRSIGCCGGVCAVWADVLEFGVSYKRIYFVRFNPSARMRLWRFVRSIPKARAAPETFQLVSSRARRMCSRSADARASLILERGPDSPARRISTGTESGVIRLPGVKIAMRSMMLRSSRALPGQA